MDPILVSGNISSNKLIKNVNETNIKANLILKQKDPDRFKYKYGSNSDESSLVKQT